MSKLEDADAKLSNTEIVEKLFRKVGEQIEENCRALRQSQSFAANKFVRQQTFEEVSEPKKVDHYSNVLVILVDQDISEKPNVTLDDVAQELTHRITNDVSICKKEETYFLKDEFET